MSQAKSTRQFPASFALVRRNRAALARLQGSGCLPCAHSFNSAGASETLPACQKFEPEWWAVGLYSLLPERVRKAGAVAMVHEHLATKQAKDRTICVYAGQSGGALPTGVNFARREAMCRVADWARVAVERPGQRVISKMLDKGGEAADRLWRLIQEQVGEVE